ncbi:hypothetical protein LTR02_001879 [Friedmanniomyces endolithicus]|nr:hypothetical protein LTR94_001451 [Friedmanniomyces endolithicus]KAK0807058.1 hypothetical protein LTR59_003388 [Friedmanniomyces endolithicus]KAK0818476.1 hypothetical protein LTR38_001058 [Friedmanniomyces endolithicus]KAK0821008.1 hypothetical protein LTR75_001078 [Friedmanniomyces endolithicus]KAK0854904.1 hypothetical protein LTS02_011285 [Friedmanniomyces endolithicus]
MLSYVALAISGLCVAYAVHTYRCFNANLAAAKQSGIPYISMPIYTFNRAWLITHRLWMPLLQLLPDSWTNLWIDYLLPDFLWTKLYTPFRDIGSDVFLLVAPGANTLYVADPEAISQITTRRNDFPKPIWMYASVDIYGKSVVSTEGANWRHHRKITSPPFTEKNNHLVWQESVHQANSMVASMVSADVERSGSVWDVAAQAMRLSLHVISKAGFGVRLPWPHEEVETKIPEGHTLSYKDALSSLLENIIVVMLTPRWLLGRSPLKIHKAANESFLEWGKYMRELYEQKKAELQTGESRDGMDLMGALVKGAGITGETNGHADPEKASPSGSKQLLTDDEIFGNAFVFILAGHETAANTIHFAMMLLAMHPQSQRRLQKDLDDILGDRPSSEWDYDEDVPKLFGSMCGAVMNEELRLIPPVVGIPKMSTAGRPQGLQLGGKHVTVPADCNVTLDTVALHRNPKYWPHTSEADLLDFRPERWLVDGGANGHHDHGHGDEAHSNVDEGLDFDDGPDKRPDTAPSLFRPAKGAYIPFSDGYRSCLGRRFAQVEILAVLAVVFKTWSIELCVGLSMSDEEIERADEEVRREAWERADKRARELLRTGMMTIITIQMRKGKVPMRFVKRGSERFDYAV